MAHNLPSPSSSICAAASSLTSFSFVFGAVPPCASQQCFSSPPQALVAGNLVQAYRFRRLYCLSGCHPSVIFSTPSAFCLLLLDLLASTSSILPATAIKCLYGNEVHKRRVLKNIIISSRSNDIKFLTLWYAALALLYRNRKYAPHCYTPRKHNCLYLCPHQWRMAT